MVEPVKSETPLFSLTSLRFFGSLAVFFFHALEVLLRKLETVNFGSASAVSLFFVLSGFILVYIYHRKMPDLGIWGFWAKRFARLWPLHIACLILVLIFQYRALTHWSGLIQTPDFAQKLLLNIAMFQNWIPYQDWAFSFNGVSWFVATEFSFCLLFPFLVRFGAKKFIWVWLTVLVLHFGGLWLTNYYYHANPELKGNFTILIQCNPLFRLLEFTSGMGVGFLFVSGIRLPSGRLTFFVHTLFEIVAVTLFALSLHNAPFGNWLYKVAYSIEWNTVIIWFAKGGSSLATSLLLIWVLASSKGLLGRLLSHPLLVYLGKISYSFYMIHYLVLILVREQFPQLDSPILAILCSLVLSIAAAAWLNILIETPFRNWLLYVLDRRQPVYRADSYTAQPIGRMIAPAMMASLISLLGFWGLWMESKRERDAILPENRQIVFKNEAVLHHIQAGHNEEFLTLQLTWEKQPQQKSIRFMHFIDQEDKIIEQYPVNAQLFRDGRIGVERVVIPWSRLENVAAIGIGFYDPDGERTSQFFNRSRTLMGWRLTIYDCRTRSIPDRVLQSTKRHSNIQSSE